jgi:cytochrome P450 family 142 subfamily A polypeptide 1
VHTTIPDFTLPAAYDDPWEAYRWLRNNDPVHWDEDGQVWVCSRHAEVNHVSRRADLYSTKHGVRPRNPVPLSILTMDDPEHFEQRSLISRGFTPRQVKRLQPHIKEITQEIIESIRERGEIEFVSEFAVHIPLIVIAELIGLDPSMRDSLHRWSDAMMGGEGRGPEDPAMETAATAATEFIVYVSGLIAERRADPREDLISILTGAFDEGDLDTTKGTTLDGTGAGTMDDGDLMMFLITLMVAGNETTRNAISGGLIAFSQFPDQRDLLIEKPELIDTAVDEIIRFVSPVLSFTRTANEDHELGGKQIKAGDSLLLLYQSANRDESVFDAPDEFRIDRSPNPHLAFGAGPHFCLGANLARLEVRTVFEELFTHFHDIRVAEGQSATRSPSSLVLGIERLPAVFTPQSA